MVLEPGTVHEKTVADIRRCIVKTISIQTAIVVGVGVGIFVLPFTVLRRNTEADFDNLGWKLEVDLTTDDSTPISLYAISVILILTSVVGILSAIRAHTIAPTDIVFPTRADPTEALSVVEMMAAQRYPMVYAFPSTTTHCWGCWPRREHRSGRYSARPWSQNPVAINCFRSRLLPASGFCYR
ncbi:uncharacterized protein LOC129587964 [Paramacrobiotus metropolitanus]|uniref:uncharacterized protein LOC129587964 n=1 Tax=Paramacrobiotus metropolitanus TaxID=2943436 RepID=UPI002445B4A5|nr:uncharacterized protein LOC129587964 [Paramacrobiotus metropolitanus]